MPLDETRKEAWERMRSTNNRPVLSSLEAPLQGGGGGGTSGGVELSMKDYVDARDAAVVSDMKAEFAGLRAEFSELRAQIARLPTTGTLIATALVAIGIVIAVMAYGGSTFSTGISLADQRQQQLKRDAEQDAALRRTDAKLDEILKRLPAKP